MIRNLLVLALLLGTALGTAPAWALRFGELRVDSRLGEPLVAEIPLYEAPPALDEVRARLASDAAYGRVGAWRAPDLKTLRFVAALDANGAPVLQVRGTQPLLESYLDLLLYVTWPDGHAFGVFTLHIPHATPGAASLVPAVPAVSTPPVPPPAAVDATAPPTAAVLVRGLFALWQVPTWLLPAGAGGLLALMLLGGWWRRRRAASLSVVADAPRALATAVPPRVGPDTAAAASLWQPQTPVETVATPPVGRPLAAAAPVSAPAVVAGPAAWVTARHAGAEAEDHGVEVGELGDASVARFFEALDAQASAVEALADDDFAPADDRLMLDLDALDAQAVLVDTGVADSLPVHAPARARDGRLALVARSVTPARIPSLFDVPETERPAAWPRGLPIAGVAGEPYEAAALVAALRHSESLPSTDAQTSDAVSSSWFKDAEWDEVDTKLDLARAYIEMDDWDAALAILDEVRCEGTAAQCQAAALLRAQRR